MWVGLKNESRQNMLGVIEIKKYLKKHKINQRESKNLEEKMDNKIWCHNSYDSCDRNIFSCVSNVRC